MDKPESQYKSHALFDMEGSAFFETACRLVSQQLVMVLKVVSDGPKNDIKNLTRQTIFELIHANLDAICVFVLEMTEVCRIEKSRLAVPDEYHKISNTWHFSQSRKMQLKQLIRRWHTLFPNTKVMADLKNCVDASSVLSYLSEINMK